MAGPKKRFTQRVAIAVTPKQKQILEEWADKEEKTVSYLVRKKLFETEWARKIMAEMNEKHP